MLSFGAEFSPCTTYRYLLWREWSAKPYVAFIGLNPSTADETNDDPTIRRCIRFAHDWGFGGIRMLNIFAFRATDSAKMKAVIDPIGLGNDAAIVKCVGSAGLVVAAWGSHGAHRSRGWEVRRKLLADFSMKCFGLTSNGNPRHPLYVRADAALVDF